MWKEKEMKEKVDEIIEKNICEKISYISLNGFTSKRSENEKEN